MLAHTPTIYREWQKMPDPDNTDGPERFNISRLSWPLAAEPGMTKLSLAFLNAFYTCCKANVWQFRSVEHMLYAYLA